MWVLSKFMAVSNFCSDQNDTCSWSTWIWKDDILKGTGRKIRFFFEGEPNFAATPVLKISVNSKISKRWWHTHTRAHTYTHTRARTHTPCVHIIGMVLFLYYRCRERYSTMGNQYLLHHTTFVLMSVNMISITLRWQWER